jgi:hypothetical protein
MGMQVPVSRACTANDRAMPFKDHEKRKAFQRAWAAAKRAKNPESSRIAARKYRAAHLEIVRTVGEIGGRRPKNPDVAPAAPRPWSGHSCGHPRSGPCCSPARRGWTVFHPGLRDQQSDRPLDRRSAPACFGRHTGVGLAVLVVCRLGADAKLLGLSALPSARRTSPAVNHV